MVPICDAGGLVAEDEQGVVESIDGMIHTRQIQLRPAMRSRPSELSCRELVCLLCGRNAAIVIVGVMEPLGLVDE